jgi:hypothetical protein
MRRSFRLPLLSTLARTVAAVLLAPWLVPGFAGAMGPIPDAPAPGFRLQPDSLETEVVWIPLEADPRPEVQRPGLMMGGGTGFVMVPQGEFARTVDAGFGVALNAIQYFSPRKRLGLRFDFSVATYGLQSSTLDLGLVEMDISTENDIFSLAMGPQLRLGEGGLQGYVRGSLGLSYFVTMSSAEDGGESHFTKVHTSDLVPTGGIGGGLLIRVRKDPNPVFLDLSVEYQSQGATRYARKGDVALVDGRAVTHTTHGRTDRILVGLGLTFGSSERSKGRVGPPCTAGGPEALALVN